MSQNHVWSDISDICDSIAVHGIDHIIYVQYVIHNMDQSYIPDHITYHYDI